MEKHKKKKKHTVIKTLLVSGSGDAHPSAAPKPGGTGPPGAENVSGHQGGLMAFQDLH